MKVNFRSLIWLVVIFALMLAVVSMFSSMRAEEDVFTYSDLVELIDEELVYSLVIDGDGVVTVEALQLEEGAVSGSKNFKKNKNGDYELLTYEYTLTYTFQSEKITELLMNAEADGEVVGFLDGGYDIQSPAPTPWYVMYLPYIILGILLVVMFVFVMKSAGGAVGGGKMSSFAKSKAKVNASDKDAVKFADVAGADEEKAELEEVVEFLKAPAKFVKLGARIPRGVLLVGPPGTGKTLLAKAVAGEAGVPFFSISGSDFVEMYVGVGASRVRDLFDNARKTPASIIFIDEIDAVGRHSGAGLGGGHDEREQTLNQLLVEMDGFGTNSGVIVMAATNRPDILDPALLRPGRFDRRVTVNYPDMKGREEILKVHCRNKPLEETVDLHKIAQTTIGFTGAELANLMNEAALRAAKKDKALIGMEDIEESYMKLILGPQKKTRVRTEADNKLCAYHEAGHAVASYFCKHTDPVKHITIIPAGNAGGVTISVPTEDRMGSSKNKMLDYIVLALGGRVAESLVLDDISTGASGDIQQATKVARNMVTRYGMSDKLGTVLYGSEHSSDEVFLGRDFSSGKNYSERTAADIDDEVRSIISDAYARCEKILSENSAKLHFVAEFLLKNEFMDGDQFEACMSMEEPTIEAIENIAIERKRKSEEENRQAQKKLEDEKRAELERQREELIKEALRTNELEGLPVDFGSFGAKEMPEADSLTEDAPKTASGEKEQTTAREDAPADATGAKDADDSDDENKGE